MRRYNRRLLARPSMSGLRDQYRAYVKWANSFEDYLGAQPGERDKVTAAVTGDPSRATSPKT